MNKSLSFIGLISLICLIGPIACSPQQNAPDPFARPTYDFNTVLQNNEFRAVADASWVTVTLNVDKTIPVKGTLNLTEGHLKLGVQNRINPIELSLTIDEASWDSGLTERDDLVRKIFFKSQGNGIRVSFASPDQGVIQKLRDQHRIDSLKVISILQWGETTLKLSQTVSLNLTPQGYLSVKTLQPIPIKISDLNHKSQLAQLIEVVVTQRKEMSIDDVVQVEVALEFEPIIPQP